MPIPFAVPLHDELRVSLLWVAGPNDDQEGPQQELDIRILLHHAVLVRDDLVRKCT
jgi:hypothetical protein